MQSDGKVTLGSANCSQYRFWPGEPGISANFLAKSEENKCELQEDMRAHHIYDNQGEPSLKTCNCSKYVRPGEQRRRSHALFILPVIAVLVTGSRFTLTNVITRHIASRMKHTRRFWLWFWFRI